jgi:DNA-binding PadR family transcriptional regulator
MNTSSLKPFTIQLLTALAQGEAHGYEITNQMQTDTIAHLYVTGRAVYRELPRLEEDGLIEAVAGTYPKRYRLTSHGRRRLRAEAGWMLQTYQLIQKRI